MPDVNILLYAYRADEPEQAHYGAWLESAMNGPSPIALSVLVAVAFVRIATNTKGYRNPMPTPVALAYVDDLASHRSCKLVAPGPSHWRLVATLISATAARGKLVADAQHAAVAIEEGCTLVSRDRDFQRFVPHGLSFQHLDLS